MASPDGVGWPDESAGLAHGSARDGSNLVAEGLGWPRRSASASGTGHGQAFPAVDGEEPPARVRQALSAAVSRETDADDFGVREEAQGSGTVRTRGRPVATAGTRPGSGAPQNRAPEGGVPGNGGPEGGVPGNGGPEGGVP